VRSLVLAVLLAGCALPPGHPGALPGQSEAMDTIWHDWLGNDSAPPEVWLVDGADLDCVTADGTPGFNYLGACRLGFTPGLALGHLISLAVHPGDRICDVPIVHEAMHAHQARRWVFDPRHRRADWRRVPAMELRLQEGT
jgi:hypothetical protein